MESTSERKVTFEKWIGQSCGQSPTRIDVMAHDASFRRYYRVTTPAASYVAMDAPPAQENCQPFVAIAQALRERGLQTPKIFAADLAKGFLLLSDFGDTTFLKKLNGDQSPALVDDLYTSALRELAVMQDCQTIADYQLSPFGREWMQREWDWHKEWFLQKWLDMPYQSEQPALDACYELLIQSAEQQPQVFMHRDYHSANLMVLENNGVGILDFQDAFIGPLTYDLASLLRDCYISWPDEKVTEWALCYAQLLRERGLLQDVGDKSFLRWFDWMGVQRHIKALLTFARKSVRDQQPGYLQHVPRTIDYITTVCQRYPELTALSDFYTNIIERANRTSECVQ